ncbi:MAG TPA: lipoyl(octanoyl) transferase LipB [Myxococcota bacterium]|nr:lipoyl(octanoyl) transferase LipB [Myxococcota bacterium]
MGDGLHIDWLGRVPYADALARQADAVEARRAGASGDRLLLLEHPPVVTLGRSAREENLRTPRAALVARGVEVHEVARGGDVTWHGPGQLVGYLIVDLAARGLADAPAFLRLVEAALADALARLGVAAEARPGMTGVFVAGSAPPRKLASIGLGLRGWISWHGFALNVTTAPHAFSDIVPCGLHGVSMTSLAQELGTERAGLLDEARAAVAAAFSERLA